MTEINLYNFFVFSQLVLNSTHFLTALATNDARCPTPENFPTGIPLVLGNFTNWAQEIELKDVWISTPRAPPDIVTLANWASRNGHTLRPSGFSLSWSPIVVTGEEGPCSKVVLIDGRQFLNKIEMVVSGRGDAAVRVGTGATWESLLTFLEEKGHTILGNPAYGGLTIGGVIATGGHGSGLPRDGEVGNSGTVGNLVLSLDAVVWNETLGSYEISTFDRRDPETSALIVNLGRVFMTEVTLMVSPLTFLRCVSRVDIPAKTLFADPRISSPSDVTLGGFLNSAGTVKVIWFPFAPNPWLSSWSLAPKKPLSTRETSVPYNYKFYNNIPLRWSNRINRMLTALPRIVPGYENLGMSFIGAGLRGTRSLDIWGTSKNLLLIVKPTTLRGNVYEYALLTKRGNIQLVVHELTTFYKDFIESYAHQNLFPMNGPMEIRVTGLDQPVFPGARAPTLSSLKPVESHPEFDTAVWIDCITSPKNPRAAEFMAKFETFLLQNFSRGDVAVRSAWAKGFAFTDRSAWSNLDFLKDYIPSSFGMRDWNYTKTVFQKYDPIGVFTNKFLRQLFK